MAGAISHSCSSVVHIFTENSEKDFPFVGVQAPPKFDHQDFFIFLDIIKSICVKRRRASIKIVQRDIEKGG